MGNVTDIVELYIKDSSLIEDTAKDVSKDLEENIKQMIGPGMVGYDTGHLHDSVTSDYAVADGVAVVMAWYGADYGQYWYRWIGGTDFMQDGLEMTMAMYG